MRGPHHSPAGEAALIPSSCSPDHLIVSSSLMLIRSLKEESRASGLYRLDKWHTSGGFGPISPALSHSTIIVAQAAD